MESVCECTGCSPQASSLTPVIYNISTLLHFLQHLSVEYFFAGETFLGLRALTLAALVTGTDNRRRRSLTQWKPDRVKCRWGWKPGWTWQSGSSGWHDGNHSEGEERHDTGHSTYHLLLSMLQQDGCRNIIKHDLITQYFYLHSPLLLLFPWSHSPNDLRTPFHVRLVSMFCLPPPV